jgi:hypothetical protein
VPISTFPTAIVELMSLAWWLQTSPLPLLCQVVELPKVLLDGRDVYALPGGPCSGGLLGGPS